LRVGSSRAAVNCGLTVNRRSATGDSQSCWLHFGRTRTLNTAVHCASVSSVSAAQQSNGQVADAPVALYGLEGWEFESLRTRRTSRDDKGSLRSAHGQTLAVPEVAGADLDRTCAPTLGAREDRAKQDQLNQGAHALRERHLPCTLIGEEASRRSQCTHAGSVRVICLWGSSWGGLVTCKQKLT